jgi:hypothetical protein
MWHGQPVRYAVAPLVFAASLAAAPAASAWTTLATGVQNTVVPSLLVTQAGTELVSFESPTGGTISIARAGGAPAVVVPGDPSAGQTELVQQPSGAIQLYFPNAQGIARLTSTDDGSTWTGPIQTQSHDLGGVSGAAVGPDGTPVFVQWHTDAVDVYSGLDGEVSRNVYPTCCGYDASVAVDTTGLVQVAFFSNATASGAFVLEPLGADLSPTGSTPLAPTAEHTPRVPLVADGNGTTFLAWAPGNPATAFSVVPFRGGQPAGDGVTFHTAFSGGDPHMALSVDSTNRLWAVWTGQGSVHAARSRTAGMDFGAQVNAPLPGTAYQISAAALPGTPGAVDVVVNTGTTLVEQQLDPGLSIRLTRTVKKVGKKTLVTRLAQALDDGIGVAGASFSAGRRTVHANATGKAALTGLPAGSAKAAAPGYAGAVFRIP